MSITASITESGVIIRRSLFFLVLILLTSANLFLLFRGLSTPQAMDQAQIAREISRGNGFTTKFIRPAAYYQAQQAAGRSVPLKAFQDTYHSPLNPLLNAAVLKIIGGDDADAWKMTGSELIFPLDRIIAATSTFFFLISIGITYLLISRIFDAKIAGVTALLIVFSSIFWDFAISGLPQMLALSLFSAGMYFAYRAIENNSEGKISMTQALIAGVFFTLMALAHWMTVWITLGYIIFAAIAFRPRGVVALVTLVMVLIIGGLTIARNIQHSGSALGIGYLTLYNGLGGGVSDAVMRTADLQEEPLSIQGLMSKVISYTILQSQDIIPFLGGIIVAPLFFISLLHPFKRKPIAEFRWLVLLAWVCMAIGLSFFGVDPKPKIGLDPNQLHILFAPIMTGYGIAFLCVLWSRLDYVAQNSVLKDAHLIAIALISAMPLVLSLPKSVRFGLEMRDKGGFPVWPPYFPASLNVDEVGLRSWVNDDEVIFSDQPWASAWYADRISIWLPTKVNGFQKLEETATSLQTPCAGILVSPSSFGTSSAYDLLSAYGDFSPLVLNSSAVYSTLNPTAELFGKSARLKDVRNVYRNPKSLFSRDYIVFHTWKLTQQDSNTRTSSGQ